MRYIKTYEQNSEPQVGDWVAVKIPNIIKYVMYRNDIDLDKIYLAKVINKGDGTFGVKFGNDFFNII